VATFHNIYDGVSTSLSDLRNVDPVRGQKSVYVAGIGSTIADSATKKTLLCGTVILGRIRTF
jgi:hypothetical protein